MNRIASTSVPAAPLVTGIDTTSKAVRPLILVLFSIANYLQFAIINLVLARSLTVGDFDTYNVALAAANMLSTLATLGFDKLALNNLPMYREQQDWARTRGFLRRSQIAIILGGGAMFTLLALALLIARTSGRWPIIAISAFVPIMSLFLYWVEVATAYGAPTLAVFLYRVVLPALVLGFNACVVALRIQFDAVTAVLSYSAAWIIVSALLAVMLRRLIPGPIRRMRGVQIERNWLPDSLSLLTYSVLMTIQVQSGVLILESIEPSTPVSHFAIALQIGTLIVVLATSTNRYYLPQLSTLIARRDVEGMKEIRRKRLLLFVPLAVAFVIVVACFGRAILRLYGPEYEAAYPALCVISVGASFTTLFSVSPYLLQFVGRRRMALGWAIGATALSIGLYWLLGRRWGHTGAAVAYSLPLCVLFVAMRVESQSLLLQVVTPFSSDQNTECDRGGVD